MFYLTFAIYGSMTLFSILAFVVELMVGKRSKTMDKPPGDKDVVATLEGHVTEDNLKGDKDEVLTLKEQAEDKDNQDTTTKDENMANVSVHRGKDTMMDNDINEHNNQKDQIRIIEMF